MNYGVDRGTATIEAALILPLIIFGTLTMFYGIRMYMAEAIVYEAATETLEYMAELSYVAECNYLVPQGKIHEYIDNEKLVESYIVDGVEGINFRGSVYLDHDGYVCLMVNYQVGISVPFFGKLAGNRSYELRQKAYIGDKDWADDEELSPDDMYVYITDNREAYHSSRGCSHLDLTITPSSKEQAQLDGYSPCEFCGNESNSVVLITKNGDRYHGRTDCIGIKRTVYRVKKSQVEGLGACQRCGG